MQDYFEERRKAAEQHYGHSNMVRSSFGTIGRITQAQAIGSLLPTAQTWDAYTFQHLKPAPKEHTVQFQQVFIEPEKKSEGCVITQEFLPTVDEDGDVVMVDAQNIIPE